MVLSLKARSWLLALVLLSTVGLKAESSRDRCLDEINETLDPTHLPQGSPLLRLWEDPALLRSYQADETVFQRLRAIKLKRVLPNDTARSGRDREFELPAIDHPKIRNSHFVKTFGMSPEEAWLTHHYNLSLDDLNDGLRTRSMRKILKLEPLILTLASGVNKLPGWSGPSFRGIKIPSETYQEFVKRHAKGFVIEEPAFMSSSEDREVALEFGSSFPGVRSVLFEIDGHSGHKLTFLDGGHDREKEVLFPPLTRFLITGLRNEKIPPHGDDFLIISLKELPPTTPLTQEQSVNTSLPILNLVPKLDPLPNLKPSQVLQEAERLLKRELDERAFSSLVSANSFDRKYEDLSASARTVEKIALLSPDFNESEILLLYQQGLIGELLSDSGSKTNEAFSHRDLIQAPRRVTGALRPLQREFTGSNEGIWALDEAGVVWLLKPDSKVPELQTSAEVITSLIYRELGYSAPNAEIVTFEGERYAAIQSFGSFFRHSTLADIKTTEFRQLRFFSALLKDHDRLQIGPNNAAISSEHFILYDFGGSLGSRAQGEAKQSLMKSKQTDPAINGFEATEDPKILIDSFDLSSLSLSHAWRNLKPLDYELAAEKLKRLTDQRIEEIVKAAKYSNPTTTTEMIRILKVRRDGLLKYLKSKK